jgi:ribonuclease BN (tRNA processing enzyme)
MRFIVLGSGTCVPSLKRNAPGYFLEVSQRSIFVDCGSGTLLQLERTGRSYRDLDAVFITHTHPDHVSDLMPLIHALGGTPEFRREKDLLIVGPPGMEKFYERCLCSVMRKSRTFHIEIIEMEDKLDLGYTHVLASRTVHSAQSFAYRFSDGERSVVISGDCDYDEGLIELSQNTDLLVLDCSYPEALKEAGHLSPKECGRIARKARVKRLLLSHLYPTPYPDEIRLEECRVEFKGKVSMAEDLMEIDL